MAFWKSQFFFVYNIPTSTSVDNINFDASIKEFLFMPEVKDGLRCGFAYSDENLFPPNVNADFHTSNVISNIKQFATPVLISCDEVWLCSMFNERPPDKSLVKTNFIFIYNIPMTGVTNLQLTNLTKSKNLIMMSGIDGKSRCSFVELPPMSDRNWEILLTNMRQKEFFGQKVEVDEIYVKVTDKVVEPTRLERQHFLELNEKRKQKQQQRPSFSSLVPPPPIPPLAISSVLSNPEIPEDSKTAELKEMLKGMNDKEVDELVDRIRSNFADMKNQASQGGTDMSQLLVNVKEIVAEQNRRKLSQENAKSIDQIQDLLKDTAPVIKQEAPQSQNEDLTANLLDSLFQPKPTKTHLYSRKMDIDEEYEPEYPSAANFVAPKRVVSMSSGDDDASIPPPPKKQAIAAASSDFASELVRSFFLFVYDIPPEVTLIALIDNVPHIDNFVFMDVMEQKNKCGFAFVKTNNDSAKEESIMALQGKRFGRQQLSVHVDEVYLHPKMPVAGKEQPLPPPAPVNFLQSVTSLLQAKQPLTLPNASTTLSPEVFSVIQQAISQPMSGVPLPVQGYGAAAVKAPTPLFPAAVNNEPLPTLMGTTPSGVRMKISPQNKLQPLKPSAAGHNEENMFGVTEDAELYMTASGNNDVSQPVFYCLEVTGVSIRATHRDIENLLLSRLHRHNVWCNLECRKSSQSKQVTQRLLMFGGALAEADQLRMAIFGRLRDHYPQAECIVTAANLPHSLAPLPEELVDVVQPKRLLLYNFPQMHIDLVLALIGRFVPQAKSYYCPQTLDKKTILGYIYLGYHHFRECKRDSDRLRNWKVNGSQHGIKIHFVVDTGYGRDGPIGVNQQPQKMGTYPEIARTRSRKTFQPMDNRDYLENYRPITNWNTAAPDLHNALERSAYNAREESLNAMRIYNVAADADNLSIRRYLAGSMGEICDLMAKDPTLTEMCVLNTYKNLSDRGLKEVIFSFKMHASLDTACGIFRDKRVRRDPGMSYNFSGMPDYERHKQDAFIPVTSSWAERRGCQHILFTELPRGTRDEVLYMLRELVPIARSWYIPVLSPGNLSTDLIVGHAVARFDDPRDARQNFRNCAPVCQIGVAKYEVRVCFAALHKVLSSGIYGNLHMPLHNMFPWFRFDIKNNKWLADSGTRQSFYCTCHVDCLPFKPLSMKAPKGVR